jgi:hypothetical protein
VGATIGRLFVGALLVLACVGCSRGDDVREIATWMNVAPAVK